MEQFKGLQKSLYIWSTSENLEKQVEGIKTATGGEVQVENINRLTFGKAVKHSRSLVTSFEF